MSTKLLNCRQTQWAKYLSCFNFKTIYYPGKAGGKRDPRPHSSGDLPQGGGGDKHLIKKQKVVLKPQNLSNNWYLSANIPSTNGRLLLNQAILKAMQTDAFAKKILTMLREGKQQYWKISISECHEYDGHILH
jgi:hypothetical protein